MADGEIQNCRASRVFQAEATSVGFGLIPSVASANARGIRWAAGRSRRCQKALRCHSSAPLR